MSRRTKRESYRVKLMKEMLFVLFTIVLVLCIAFFIDATVVGQEDGNITVDEEYFRVLEHEYVKSVRYFLTEQGYENSGVNLTMVADEEGNRNYSLQLHHKKMETLTEVQLAELFDAIENMSFHVAGCSFEVSLLL